MANILIVDDETLVRRSLQKTLQRQGYVVETASDCTSGLRLFLSAQDQPGAFDFAILDLNMPGFDGVQRADAGFELMEKLIGARPDLPIVILTAYDETAKARAALKQGAVHFWVKGHEEGLTRFIEEQLGETGEAKRS